jgi:hypothetical protein
MRKRKSTNSEPWYGAQLVFRSASPESRYKNSYEERVVLIRADSWEEAIAKAEAEAKEYCEPINAQYTGFIRVFHIFDGRIGDKAEVFSIIRDSNLGPKAYLDRFYDTGTEYERRVGKTARWKSKRL